MDYFDIREKSAEPGQAGIVRGRLGGCRYERSSVVSEMPRVSLTVVPADKRFLASRLQIEFAFIKVAS